jgi:hypothetical protein
MNDVVRFHCGKCGNPLFLFAANDIAMHIYENREPGKKKNF